MIITVISDKTNYFDGSLHFIPLSMEDRRHLEDALSKSLPDLCAYYSSTCIPDREPFPFALVGQEVPFVLIGKELKVPDVDLPRFRGEMRAWDQALWL